MRRFYHAIRRGQLFAAVLMFAGLTIAGFVTKDGEVWGRPVGVTVGRDGDLYVTDDGSRSVWRVTYTGK